MSLSVGIVGLPNVGKSTLFNALLKRQAALVANYPFATIEPNIGVVPVSDERLDQLAKIVDTTVIKPAVVNFVDIAGLVKGANKGEGLGNKFLSHIREAQVICHVLRAFENTDIIREGAVSPKEDLETIRMELQLADLATLEKQVEPKGNTDKKAQEKWQIISDYKRGLSQGVPALESLEKHQVTAEIEPYALVAKELGLLTAKSELFVVNVSEQQLTAGSIEALTQEFVTELGQSPAKILVMCNQIENELSSLSLEDQKLYLKDLGLSQGGLERLIAAAYQALGLQSFLTAGKKEVRAWTITKGTVARKAAGVIHTDFEKKMISANIVKFDDFVALGGWKAAKEIGKLRTEGRDYVMQDGDVVEFLIGS